MNPLKSTFLLLLLFSTSCFGQTFSGTFQGKIADSAPVFLHIEAKDGVATGYYIYPSGKLTLPLKGSIDNEGNIKLTNSTKSFPAFTGKLSNRVIQGSFIASKEEKPKNFYVANLEGNYRRCDEKFGRFSVSLQLWLTYEGYELRYYSDSDTKKCIITTHIDSKGQIYLQCDSLDGKLYLNGDALLVETRSDLSSLISQKETTCEEKLVFRLFHHEDEYKTAEGLPKKTLPLDFKEIKLSDDYSVRFRQLSEGEYIARMFETAHLRHKPYREIKDVAEAQRMLGSRLKVADNPDHEGLKNYEITFNDNTKKKFIDSDIGFVAYYPDVEVLLFEGGHASDYPLDLNDSANERVGNPQYHALSPDKKFRINGYYNGQECSPDFLEKWNKSKNKFEFINHFDVFSFGTVGDNDHSSLNDDNPNAAGCPEEECNSDHNENQKFDFCYNGGWFWINNHKVLFMNYKYNRLYYEMEIVEKK